MPPSAPTPTITVVIPSYNHARYIPDTIRSVLRQTHPGVHLHILDDGSKDDSTQVIEQILSAEGNSRCRLHSRPNRGCSETLNELIAATDTDYVAILNSDDLFTPDRLARILALAVPGRSFFGISMVDFFGDAEPVELDNWRRWYATMLRHNGWFPSFGFAALRANFAITSSNFVFSRDLFDRTGGFRDELPLSQDWDFLVRALRWAEPVLIPEPLLHYRVHATNTYRKHVPNRRQEIVRIMDDFVTWANVPNANRLAPTPFAWPRYFSLCARTCQANSGLVLGALLPESFQSPLPSHPGSALPTDLEAKVIRHWVRNVARDATEPETDPDSGARNCARHWAEVATL